MRYIRWQRVGRNKTVHVGSERQPRNERVAAAKRLNDEAEHRSEDILHAMYTPPPELAREQRFETL